MATPITDNIVAIGYDTSSAGVASLRTYTENASLFFETNSTAKSSYIAIDSGLRTFVSNNENGGTIKRFDSTGTYDLQKVFASTKRPGDLALKQNQSIVYTEGDTTTFDSIVFMDRDFNQISTTFQNSEYFSFNIDLSYEPSDGSRLFTSGVSNDGYRTDFGSMRVYTTENDSPTLEFSASFYDPSNFGPSADQSDVSYYVAATEDGTRYAHIGFYGNTYNKSHVVLRNGSDHSVIARYSIDGTYPTYFSGTSSDGVSIGGTPTSIGFDTDNNLIIHCNDRVIKYDTSGSLVYSELKTTSNVTGLSQPMDVDSGGQAWVRDGNEVSIFSPTGVKSSINYSNRAPINISSRKSWWGAPLSTPAPEICRTEVILTPSNAGGSFLTTAQSKFGNSSLYGNNSGWLKADSLVIPQTGEFTLE